jgi:hypothetical protein
MADLAEDGSSGIFLKPETFPRAYWERRSGIDDAGHVGIG